MSRPQVVVYTQPGCQDCERLKAWLAEHQVPYHERNVREDVEALWELVEKGLHSTPVTLVDGTVVEGFDEAQLRRLLEL